MKNKQSKALHIKFRAPWESVADGEARFKKLKADMKKAKEKNVSQYIRKLIDLVK